MSKIYIGTSGWTYEHWQRVFYPSDLPRTKRLDYYTHNFNTVELNASFYHLPKPETFYNWQKQTPKDFIFAVKASRYITHIKKLKNCKEPWKRFIDSAKELNGKLGPILFQLPPFLKINLENLGKFLKTLPKKYSYVLEPRHESWFCEDLYKILKKHRVALCVADSPYWPCKEIITSSFIYLRFHGGTDLYGSNYSKKELKDWAEKIKKWKNKKMDIYAYFNNDACGYAVVNAKQLKQILKV